MLLPSALPFDTFHQTHKSSSGPTPFPSSPGGGFLSLSSCRALQAILGNIPTSPSPLKIITTTPGSQPRNEKLHPETWREQPQRKPLQALTQNIRVPQSQPNRVPSLTAPPYKPLKSQKRSRADFESAEEKKPSRGTTKTDSLYPDYPHCATSTSTNTSPNSTSRPADDLNRFSTPKRRRRAPSLMPLGLRASDFDRLDPASMTPPAHPWTSERQEPHEDKDKDEDVNRPAMPTTTTTNKNNNEAARSSKDDWSADDDRILVSNVLDKLSLSRGDWSDYGEGAGGRGGGGGGGIRPEWRSASWIDRE